MLKLRIVHYVNQLFTNIDGEKEADCQPELGEDIVDPGMALNQAFGEEAETVTTVICGDPYFNKSVGAAKKTILDTISSQKSDAVICRPAFNVGRYGVACDTVALVVKGELNLPVLAGMYKENPGADVYKTKVYAVGTKNSTAGVRSVVATMAPLVLKLVKGRKPGSSKEEGYMPNGIRVSSLENKRGPQRVVEMLIRKLSGRKFTTEFPMPDFDRVDPNPAVKDVAHAKITLVISGGIVPKDNPDYIEFSSASKYGKHDIDSVMDLTETTYETVRGGYDPVCANEDADRVPLVSVLREFEKEGKIGSLHRYFCTMAGNGTSVANSKRFAAEFAQELRNNGVDAVILTFT